MKRLLAAVLPLILSLSFLSCAGESRLAYQSEALSFTAVFRVTGLECTALVSLAADSGEEERDAVLTFSAPAALAGMVFSRQNGELTASLGGHTTPLPYGDSFAFLQLFEIDLPLTASVREKGATVCIYSDGETAYTVTFPDGASLPSDILREGVDGDLSVRILP